MTSVSARLSEENEQLRARLAELENELSSTRDEMHVWRQKAQMGSETRRAESARSANIMRSLREKLETADKKCSAMEREKESIARDSKLKSDQLRKAADDISALQRRLDEQSAEASRGDSFSRRKESELEQELAMERGKQKELVGIVGKLIMVIRKHEQIAAHYKQLVRLDHSQLELDSVYASRIGSVVVAE
jgi:chromosome segregation ATPase